MNQTQSVDETPSWVHCGVAALTGAQGAEHLVKWFRSALTDKEIFAIFKGIARRYLGYLGVALAVYEFGECMHWW